MGKDCFGVDLSNIYIVTYKNRAFYITRLTSSFIIVLCDLIQISDKVVGACYKKPCEFLHTSPLVSEDNLTVTCYLHVPFFITVDFPIPKTFADITVYLSSINSSFNINSVKHDLNKIIIKNKRLIISISF